MKKIFLGGLIICGFLLFLPVQAEETASSTPEIIPEETTTESSIEITTSTSEITPSPTSTQVVETPTTTVSSTPDISTPTTTPTSTEPSIQITENTPTTSLNQFITASQIDEAVNKILNYLKSQQDETGKIIDGTITDWAIMSFGANNQYADEIKKGSSTLLDYEKNYNLDDLSDLNSCASYPRHILALLAAGVGKDDAAIIGLKNKIETVCFQNNLYGLPGINDDVFALLGLLATEVSNNEPIITDIISTIKADQTTEGAFTWSGWAGADMTGAAINALKYAESKGAIVEQQIYSKAKQYLKTIQLPDGGWGYGVSDILTTSWALMGINALDERQDAWFTASGTNPWSPLVNQLKNDGFYESAWVPGTVDWFAEKHAVPALLGKAWPIVLPTKIVKLELGENITYAGGGGGVYIEQITQNIEQNTTTTPTSTCTDALQCVSTTTLFSTSTEQQNSTIITETTTTITNNQETITKQIQNPNKQIKKSTNKPLNITTTPQFEPTSYKLQAASSTPENPAKTVFGVSLTAASGLGLYLAWRLLQTLV